MTGTTRASRRLAAVATALLVLGLAACGDDDDDSASSDGGTTTTTEADACTQARQLKADIENLADVDVSEDDGESLDTALGNIEDEAEDLASTTNDELKPEIDDVKSSLEDLKTAVGQIGESGGIRATLDAVEQVVNAAQALDDKIGSADCGS